MRGDEQGMGGCWSGIMIELRKGELRKMSDEPMIPLGLRCWQCGKTKDVLTNRPPLFAVDLISMAKEAGWIGVVDMFHGRSLIFCTHECHGKAKKKDGSYRKRPLVEKTEG